MSHCQIDHLTITAPNLEAGESLVKRALGVPLQAGGEHPLMGTHNRLLRLGDSTFLEVIARNPNAPPPGRPRWFALDQLEHDSPATLKTWVARTNDLRSALANCPEPLGKVETLSRGKRRWLMAIPEDGSLPINEGAPTLMQWQTGRHPAASLADHGVSLLALEIHNPEADRIRAVLSAMRLDGDIRVSKRPEKKLIAHIQTPRGIRALSV